MTTKAMSVPTPTLPAVHASDSNALMSIIERAATDSNFDVAKLDALLAVKERWEKEEARKAFVSALTDFKADPPDIFKNKSVAFKDVRYSHASLDNVSIAIGTSLAKHGLSHRWDVEQKDGKVRVTCVLMHSAGHSERVSMEAGADQSGSKNAIQALGSTVTYLERYSLLSITGMAVQDQDDDGQTAEPAKPIKGPEEHPAGWAPAVQPGAKMGTAAAAPVVDPVMFHVAKGGVTKAKTTPAQFKIKATNGKDYFTMHEKVALSCKEAGESGAEVRALLTLKGQAYWVDSVDVTARKEF